MKLKASQNLHSVQIYIVVFSILLSILLIELLPDTKRNIFMGVSSAPAGSGRTNVRAHIARLRDPMPWEDGYFDPSYHAWPKNRQSGVKATSKEISTR